MLRRFKRRHELPDAAQTAIDIVKIREGKKHVKDAVRLYRLAGMPPTGRLQPSMWNKLLDGSHGLLGDKGLLEAAQAHLRVARALQTDGYEEVKGVGGDVGSEEIYGYVRLDAPVSKVSQPGPPPYDGAGSSPQGWICFNCGLQNAEWRDICYNCGAHKPHPNDCDKKALPPGDAPTGSSSTPLYPVLTPSGSYYSGPASAQATGNTQSGTQGHPPVAIFPNMAAPAPSNPMPNMMDLFLSPEAQAVLRNRRYAIEPENESQSSRQSIWEFDSYAPQAPASAPPPAPPVPPPQPPPPTQLSPVQAPEQIHIQRTPVRPEVVPPGPSPSIPETLFRPVEQWTNKTAKTYVGVNGGTVTVTVGLGDITTTTAEVIVNPANSSLQHNGGVARVLSLAAGPSLQKDSDCLVRDQGPVETGSIAVTGPGNLPVSLIVHAVGPVYDPSRLDSCQHQLQSVIWNTLMYLSSPGVREKGLKSVIFPLISVGVFKYPAQQAVPLILQTIKTFLATQDTQLTDIRIITDDPDKLVLLEESLKKGPVIKPEIPVNYPSSALLQASMLANPVSYSPALSKLPTPEDPTSTWVQAIPSSPATEGGLKYIKFTPSQVSTLVSTLPDPEKQPMPFYRKMCQIQKTYAATWQDLNALTEIKASDSFLPLMAPAFDSSQSPTIDTYSSGLVYCQQLKAWAQDALTDLQGSLQDVTQNLTESVEQYSARLQMAFDDLGFSPQHKAHRLLLTKAFVEGLKEDVKKKIESIRPDCVSGTLQDATAIAKGFARSLAVEAKEAEKESKERSKKKAVALMMQDGNCDDTVLCPVVPPLAAAPMSAPNPPPTLATYPSEPGTTPYQTYPQYLQYTPCPASQYAAPFPYPLYPRPDSNQRRGLTCWNCGRNGHVKRECRNRSRSNRNDQNRPYDNRNNQNHGSSYPL